jgi:hypothetical protein
MLIASIVEGDGEFQAVPLLLRRLQAWRSPLLNARPLTPIRVRRDRFLHRDDEFRKQLLLAAAKSGDQGWILILLDADDDCPANLGAEVLRRAQAVAAHRRISVVLAKREFEAWFLAAARSLDGARGFRLVQTIPADAESPRNAKKWLELQMAGSYSEVIDQPAFTAVFDLQQAYAGSRSFRKLCSEWDRQVNAFQGVPSGND